ncbi:hypothetical protein [Paenarthrobacter sp. C1]|uniref:hypothetical protein n=1 Tax=Paenarthrobacter sp. C1 TaxID=3400220 RepID=UPI003BF466D1
MRMKRALEEDRFGDDELRELLVAVLSKLRGVPADDVDLQRDVTAAVAARAARERGDAGHAP